MIRIQHCRDETLSRYTLGTTISLPWSAALGIDVALRIATVDSADLASMHVDSEPQKANLACCLRTHDPNI